MYVQPFDTNSIVMSCYIYIIHGPCSCGPGLYNGLRRFFALGSSKIFGVCCLQLGRLLARHAFNRTAQCQALVSKERGEIANTVPLSLGFRCPMQVHYTYSLL